MKTLKILLFLVSLLSQSLCFGAAYTSSQAGNWSSASTWGNSGPPGNGDTATCNHAVTVDTNTTIGTSPSDSTTFVLVNGDNGSITIGDNISLTVRGNADIQSGSDANRLIFGPGSKYIFDPSQASVTTTNYVLQTRNRVILYARGTSINPAYIESVAGYGNGYLQLQWGGHGCNFDADYLNFTRVGTAAIKALTLGTSIAAQGMTSPARLTHSVLDSCGGIYINAADGAAVINFSNNKAMNELDTSASSIQVYGLASMTGSITFNSNSIGLGGVTFSPAGNVDLNGNYLGGGVIQSGYNVGGSFKTFSGNLVRYPGANQTLESNASSCYFIKDASVDNPGMFTWVTYNDNRTIDSSIFDYTYSSKVGDLVMPQNDNSKTHTFSNNIMLTQSTEGPPGKFFSLLTGGCSTIFDHNTFPTDNSSSESVGVGVGENGGAANSLNEITSFKGNLAWTPPGLGGGYKIRRQVNGGTFQDYVYSANADYNWGYNLSAGSDGKGYDGDAASLFSSGSPGVHDGAGDPRFVDTTRNFVTYDRARLGNTPTSWAASTVYAKGDFVSTASAGYYGNSDINYRCITAHTSASGDATNGQPGVAANWRINWEFASAYRIRNDLTMIADLMAWVRKGLAPRNGALKGVAHDGGDIGAVPVWIPRRLVM